jgi:hypothetical protein
VSSAGGTPEVCVRSAFRYANGCEPVCGDAAAPETESLRSPSSVDRKRRWFIPSAV